MPNNGSQRARRMRHALIDRLFHWSSAASVLILLTTSLLPVLGVDFAWVTIHWVTGITLAVLVIGHIIRAIFWQRLMTMWIGARDVAEVYANLRGLLGGPYNKSKVGGKYSVAQKAIHQAFSVVVVTAIVTGGLMLVKIDTPWWERDPYWLGDRAWGFVYVLHDLAALCLVTMVLVHVYFALRPEKLYLTRSMILGWITAREYDENYDSSRWTAERD